MQTERLFDFNLELSSKLFSLLKCKFSPAFTEQFILDYDSSVEDLRNFFHPGKRNLNDPEYRQVFHEKHGFLSDLSMIDLLFNKGLKALEYMEAPEKIPPH